MERRWTAAAALVALVLTGSALPAAAQSDRSTVLGSGCAPAADVTVIRVSDGVTVGQALADVSGDFAVEVDVSPSELSTTALEARCRGNDGTIQAIPLGSPASQPGGDTPPQVDTPAPTTPTTTADVAGDDLSDLPRTGPMLWAWLVATAIVLLNSGWAVLRAAARRRPGSSDLDDFLT